MARFHDTSIRVIAKPVMINGISGFVCLPLEFCFESRLFADLWNRGRCIHDSLCAYGWRGGGGTLFSICTNSIWTQCSRSALLPRQPLPQRSLWTPNMSLYNLGGSIATSKTARVLDEPKPNTPACHQLCSTKYQSLS